eukprot:72569-Ditylum_brightwellii.AAC.1
MRAFKPSTGSKKCKQDAKRSRKIAFKIPLFATETVAIAIATASQNLRPSTDPVLRSPTRSRNPTGLENKPFY